MHVPISSTTKDAVLAALVVDWAKSAGRGGGGFVERNAVIGMIFCGEGLHRRCCSPLRIKKDAATATGTNSNEQLQITQRDRSMLSSVC